MITQNCELEICVYVHGCVCVIPDFLSIVPMRKNQFDTCVCVCVQVDYLWASLSWLPFQSEQVQLLTSVFSHKETGFYLLRATTQ